MASLQKLRKVYWPFGVVVVLLSVFSIALAGTSSFRSATAAYSKSPDALNRDNLAKYSHSVIKKTVLAPTTEARSAHDHHGRTLILKSLILAPLALVVFILLLILIIPIPVISSPLVGTGRSYPSSSSSPSSFYRLELAKEVFTAEECVERMSCELSRLSRSYESTAWIPSTLERLLLRNRWSERIIRGLKAKSDPSCRQFTCSPAKTLKRSLKIPG